MSEEHYFLMRDTPGEKAPGTFKKMVGMTNQKLVLRGELLSPIPYEKEPRFDVAQLTYYLSVEKDPAITLFVVDSDISPLNIDDYFLLKAIDTPSDRFRVFSDFQWLEWGANLKVGALVFVRLPSPIETVPTWSQAIIRYKGRVKNLSGTNFGVEIMDPSHRGKGTSDGVFQNHPYFACQNDCALFVSLDKLWFFEPKSVGMQGGLQGQQLASGHQSFNKPPLYAAVTSSPSQSQPPHGQRKPGDLSLSPQDLIAFAQEFKVTDTEFLEEQKRALKELEEQKRKRDQQKVKREVKQALGENITSVEQRVLDEIKSQAETGRKQGSPDQSTLNVGCKDMRRQRSPNMQQIEDLTQQIKELKTTIEHQQKESNTKIAKLQQDLQSERDSSSRFQQLSTELQQQLAETKTENSSLLTSQKESVAFGIEPWKVHRNKVELGNVLGGGGWGVVYKGKLQVAVKQFYPNIMSKQNLALLKREMRMLALIRHPNLLQFIAAVFDENEDYEQKPPYIITELLDKSLRSAYENAQLPSHSLLSIFIDTARALDYLHRRHEPIIHRDVSSANVLLRREENGKWIAKLSDLGSANLAKEAYTMNAGARPYCAPEAFTFNTNARSAGTLTPKIDVYSYGIMLCEVATSTFPEEGKYPSMLARVRREWPQLHPLIVACTNQSPEHRPTMENVLASLEAFPPRH